MLKKIALVLLAILVIIQFFHPPRNKAAGSQPNNIAVLHPVPAEVKTILDRACMDCHSNNTAYPWYSKIQPVDWWLTNHVTEGKEELNFDEFTGYSLRRQYHKLEEISKTVKENEMPMDSYTWVHKEARLSEGEKTRLISWADSIRTDMKGKYPADSLRRI